jgi:hypothetical protein
MSIKTRIAAFALGALIATGSLAAAATSAEARDFHEGHGFHEDHGFHDGHGFDEGHGFHEDHDSHHGWGWGRRSFNDGFYNDSDYSGYGYCRWVPRFDINRNYIGRVRSCGY